jgi:chemotaxis protein CheZ
MQMTIGDLQKEYGESLATLSGALAAGDESRFVATLDALIRRREQALFGELRKLSEDLQAALDRFTLDSRLLTLAEKEVPDARHRLDHVLKLTDEAAHRTMDLVEKSAPLAEKAAREAAEIGELWRRFRARSLEPAEFRAMVERLDAFLAATQGDMEHVRGNLSEVLLAQGFQDLSGQIIRSVMNLVAELETSLADLIRISKGDAKESTPAAETSTRGFGPAVPGINNGTAVGHQDDVDALLSGLGM